MYQASVWSSPDFTGRQVTLNLIFLLKIQILASFSYQAVTFTHFPIILRKKNFRFICTLIVALNEYKIASSIPDSLSTVLVHCLCQKRCIMRVLPSWQEIFAGHFYNKTSYQNIDCENLNDCERSMDSLKSMFSSLCLRSLRLIWRPGLKLWLQSQDGQTWIFFVFTKQYRNCFSRRINALMSINQPIKTDIGMVMHNF